jgi:hypothetical protein
MISPIANVHLSMSGSVSRGHMLPEETTRIGNTGAARTGSLGDALGLTPGCATEMEPDSVRAKIGLIATIKIVRTARLLTWSPRFSTPRIRAS